MIVNNEGIASRNWWRIWIFYLLPNFMFFTLQLFVIACDLKRDFKNSVFVTLRSWKDNVNQPSDISVLLYSVYYILFRFILFHFLLFCFILFYRIPLSGLNRDGSGPNHGGAAPNLTPPRWQNIPHSIE